MCAFDLPDREIRKSLIRACLEGGLIVLPCGPSSVRFRPALVIRPQEIDEALDRLGGAIKRVMADLPARLTAN